MSLQLSSIQRSKLLELYQTLSLDFDHINIQINPTSIIVQAHEQSTQIMIPTQYQRTQTNKFNKYINDALNASTSFDEGLYQNRNLLLLINIATDMTKTNGQRIYAYSKTWELLQNNLLEQNLTLKQIQQRIQQMSGQNGYRFVAIAQRANRLMTLLGGIFILEFRYITPNYLFHLTSSDFEYFIKQVNERMNRALDDFAGAQS